MCVCVCENKGVSREGKVEGGCVHVCMRVKGQGGEGSGGGNEI